MTRLDGRSFDSLRAVEVDLGVQRNPEGSVLYRCGQTTILVAASVENSVPDWMAGKRKGWVTAEYSMHPRANPGRQKRARDGRIDGRSQEIQRLIGRALRGAVDHHKLGERLISVDCDVLDADGGTRTASITGGFIALVLALDKLRQKGLVQPGVLKEPLSAVSVGLVEGQPLLDLCYSEDHDAQVDLNVVATRSGSLVEVQGTAEGEPLPRAQFDELVGLALAGAKELADIQLRVLRDNGIDYQKLLA